jgi:hypothetical protein
VGSVEMSAGSKATMSGLGGHVLRVDSDRSVDFFHALDLTGGSYLAKSHRGACSPTFRNEPMSASPAEIRKALVAAGFELYRTHGNEVKVADRVRDNLIMDSGVSVSAKGPLIVKMVVRAQRSDFPNDATAALFERARALAAAAASRGYIETETVTNPMHDPADPSRTLDTWYEVCYEKSVPSLDEAMIEVGFALRVEKTARSPAPTSV